LLDCGGRSPQWRHAFDQVSPSERAALAGFLLTIALVRNVRRREFGVVHELLRTGYALGLVDGPASSQSAEMLERLTTFEQITGVAGADVEWQPAASR
jgi:hypothetical protein